MVTIDQQRNVRDDRVLGLTRGVSLVIIPFLVVAFVVLVPWPSDTGRLFAWHIKPTLTAMVLGSVYLGGAYFFLRAFRAKEWHTVKGGFVPVGTFATLMGVATIAHWDKFLHTHVAFWLWAGLYFTTPFLVFGVYLANRRHDAPATSADLLISVGVSRIIAIVGGLSLLTGVFLFLLPNRAVTIWPWTLTPLTSRVLGAIFCLGVAGLGALVDRRWSSARVLLQVAAVMLALIVVAGARATGEFDSANAMTWLISAGFIAVLAAIVVLYLRMETRRAEPGGRGHVIDALIERMQALLVPLRAANDPRQYFHATYLRTTIAVAAAIRGGGFIDPEWAERWDVTFASLYLDALELATSGSQPTRPWQIAFGAPSDLPALNHVLLGMNAHINFDLPQALLMVITDEEFDSPAVVAKREEDHRAIDRVLASRVAAEDDELVSVSGPGSALDRLLRPLNQRASQRLLRESREKVWANAVTLSQARRQGPDTYAAVLTELEELSAAKVSALTAPGFVLLKLAVTGFGVRLRPRSA